MENRLPGGDGLDPMHKGGHMLGQAITVRVPPGDNLMVHKAIDIAAPGVGVIQQTICDGGKNKCEVFPGWAGTSMASPHVAAARAPEAPASLPAGLVPPALATYRSTGKRGVHTEHMGYILADMQYLQRTYPGGAW